MSVYCALAQKVGPKSLRKTAHATVVAEYRKPIEIVYLIGASLNTFRFLAKSSKVISE